MKIRVKNTFCEFAEVVESPSILKRSSSIGCARDFDTAADVYPQRSATPPAVLKVEEGLAQVAATLPPGYSLTLRNDNATDSVEESVPPVPRSSGSTSNLPLPPTEASKEQERQALLASHGSSSFMHVAAVLPPGGRVTVRNEAACAPPPAWVAGPLATQPGYSSQIPPHGNAPGVWPLPPPILPLLPEFPPWSAAMFGSGAVASTPGAPLPQPSVRVSPGFGGALLADAASRRPLWQPPSWAAGATNTTMGHPYYQTAHDYGRALQWPLATQPVPPCGAPFVSTPPTIGIWPPNALLGNPAVHTPLMPVHGAPQAGVDLGIASKSLVFPSDQAPSEVSLEEEPAPEEPEPPSQAEGSDEDVSPNEQLHILRDAESPPLTPQYSSKRRSIAWDTPKKAIAKSSSKTRISKAQLAASRPEWMRKMKQEEANDERCPECHQSLKALLAGMEFLPTGLELTSSGTSTAVGLCGTARRRPRRFSFKTCETCGRSVRQTNLPRLWCSFYLQMRHPSFDLVPMLIGKGGCNTRRIAGLTGTKVRVRGKGSGHREVPTGREAPTPLMLVVATEAENPEGFKEAVRLSVELLRNIEARYKEFCSETGHVDNTNGFVIGPPFDNGDRTELKAILGEVLPEKSRRGQKVAAIVAAKW